MAALVQLAYRVNATTKTGAALNAILAAVPLPADELSFLGVSVFADATANDAVSATRTISLNLDPAFKANFPNTSDQAAPFRDLLTGHFRAACCYPIVAAAPLLLG